MTLLVLNRRPILGDLPQGFPGSRQSLVVIAARSAEERVPD
jgi:hypothetical protein